jgi:non-heme chloroperoxidase
VIKFLVGLLLAGLLQTTGLPVGDAQAATAVQSRFFTTSDGEHLHYLEAGSGNPQTIVFVPGWTMPAWIWEHQIDVFARAYHVVAFDPRGQGESEIARSGYEPARRGRDIGELIGRLGREPVLVVAWSLGVLDTLAYLKAAGDGHIAGLVLVDNSIGEEPAPAPSPPPSPGLAKPPHAVFMRQFVRSMFRTRQAEAWLDRLTQTCLRTPEPASKALLAYPVPRSFWRDAVYSTDKPVLYVVRPRWTGQAENLVNKHRSAEMVVFAYAGHALFVDDPVRFNDSLADFIHRRVWP